MHKFVIINWHQTHNQLVFLRSVGKSQENLTTLGGWTAQSKTKNPLSCLSKRFDVAEEALITLSLYTIDNNAAKAHG